MTISARATLEDLYRVPEHGKGELVNGGLVLMSPASGRHGRAAGAIYVSLRQHERQAGGYAYPDNVGFVVDLPNRRSFSPDVAFHGAQPTLRFVEGAPAFAVEVRSDDDAGAAGERAMARKREDYFAAGTRVVWDVELEGTETIRVYRSADAEPTVFRRGDVADAEPAVPGWRFPVDLLFE